MSRIKEWIVDNATNYYKDLSSVNEYILWDKELFMKLVEHFDVKGFIESLE